MREIRQFGSVAGGSQINATSLPQSVTQYRSIISRIGVSHGYLVVDSVEKADRNRVR